MYECESWCPLTASNLLTLERAHRFCVKHLQSLGRRTHTDIALGLLGIIPLEIEIEIRKLILFGQLCRLSSKYWVKNIFLNKLSSYTINPYKQTGFISDIEKILNNYQLTHVLDMYFSDGIFPGQLAWKRMLNSNVKIVLLQIGILEYLHLSLVDLNPYILIFSPIFSGFIQGKT